MNKHLARILIAVFVLGIAATACNGYASSPASCAFVVGTGVNGYDADLHKILYPGQQLYYVDGESPTFVPCNSRNYIINDGTVTNANGDVLGDRDVLISATTETGVPITIAARALWTLNQTDAAMRKFYTLCFKYQCSSDEDQSGDANFSTEGWNGMLAENLGPAMDSSARLAAITIDDSIWQSHNPTKYKELADGMSAVIANEIRANTGFTEDIFCGSGNSIWSGSKPGEGTFNCSPVRIVVDDVQPEEIRATENTEGALAIGKQRLENAEAIYGSNAGFWLALQDTIEKCKDSRTTCIFNLGGGSDGPLSAPWINPPSLPSDNLTPTPTP